MKKIITSFVLLAAVHLHAQKLSQQVAETTINSWKNNSTASKKYNTGQAILFNGIEGIWNATGEGKWFNYIQQSLDAYVQNDGTIKGCSSTDDDLDCIDDGNTLLLLYKVTGKEKYKKAADLLYQQLNHYSIDESWLNKKPVHYLVLPFNAAYAQLFHKDTMFNEIAKQLGILEKKINSHSKYLNEQEALLGVAMVQALDYFPDHTDSKKAVVALLNHFAKNITQKQDAATSVWHSNAQPSKTFNDHFDTTTSCMLIYTLAKAVRKNYLPSYYNVHAKKAYAVVSKSFQQDIKKGDQLKDMATAAAFINAAVEMEMLPTLAMGNNKTIVLDYCFNNEWKKDATGTRVRYHYTWDDESNNGFSMLGKVFNRYGIRTRFLEASPTAENLKGADFYIIVDPDTDKETEKPNYMNTQAAGEIAGWVKKGGVLILMGNDANNAELKNFNLLCSQFGIRFNEDDFNLVKNDQFEQGSVMIPAGNKLFKTAKKIFIKEASTLKVSAPANTILSKEGKGIAAIAKYGKGAVFVIGDPWLYNEYFDGRKLPADFDNYKAAEDLIRWAISQSKK